jgi:hypothetical protein
MSAHYFWIEDLGAFTANLQARGYAHRVSHGLEVYSKTLSKALVRHYAHVTSPRAQGRPVRVRVTYDVLKNGAPLGRLAGRLKELNRRYRRALPGWKTRVAASPAARHRRWAELHGFLQKNAELVSCFKSAGAGRGAEGNYRFNLHVASTPAQQRVCLEFIKALVDADAPYGIMRGRRRPDPPVRQRNGWIRRYTAFHRRRGWRPAEIVRGIQRELRSGSWNQRGARVQYNIAENTICKIAGMKLPRFHMN